MHILKYWKPCQKSKKYAEHIISFNVEWRIIPAISIAAIKCHQQWPVKAWWTTFSFMNEAVKEGELRFRFPSTSCTWWILGLKYVKFVFKQSREVLFVEKLMFWNAPVGWSEVNNMFLQTLQILLYLYATGILLLIKLEFRILGGGNTTLDVIWNNPMFRYLLAQ